MQYYYSSFLPSHFCAKTLQYPLSCGTFCYEIFGQAADDLSHFVVREAVHGGFNHAADTRLVHGDETLIVHEGKEAHDELAVHSIRDATVTGDRFAKVLDLEGSFQAGGEEAAKRGDERGESGEEEDMELHGRDVNGPRKKS